MNDRKYPADLFQDPQQSGRKLLALQQEFLRSGSRFPIDQFDEALRKQLLTSPDPGMALTNLIRFSEAVVSKTSLFNDLVQYPVSLDVLVKIFGFSQYFADILVRESDLFRWLTTSDALMVSVTRPYLDAEVGRLRAMFEKPERRLEALKRIHRREMLRIGAQDLLGNADLVSVAAQLSNLADVIVSAVCEICVEQLGEKFGTGLGVPFAVIGLGKLGGEELNYSSDIDVMFVYGSEGEFRTPRGQEISHHEYFVRLSEKIVQHLSQPTAGGHLYRVDARLRPESGAGPLARSVRGYLTYYESRGELWERQMLIKARAIAGDVSFGELFLHELDPFVYPRTLMVHPAGYIARIKGRIEAAVGDEANVKLMPGGIRDIEFIVQALQILYGGKRKVLRERNTLRALRSIAKEGLLGADDEAVLRDAYIFHRTLEHRMQTLFNTQTHVIPQDDAARTSLAKRMGIGRGADLLAQSAAFRQGVRSIFDRVMATPEGGEAIHQREAEGIIAVLDGGLPEAAVHTILSKYGFKDVRLAARHLKSLATGSALTDLHEHDSRTRDALRRVSPQLFADIARSRIPDMTLANIALVAAAQKFPEQFYQQLQHEGFRRFLLQVSATSPRFARGLANNPLLLESLASNIATLVEEQTISLPAPSEALTFKQSEELRIGIRHLLGFTSFDTMTEELTQLADAIVASIVEDESRRAGVDENALGVFAVGKFGTREITFDADLDLVFVSEAADPSRRSLLERLAGRVIARLGTGSGAGKIYEVDARLRPEGKNAPLVVEAASYAAYLTSRASLWERQSLTRLRTVHGEQSFMQRLKTQVDAFVYGTPLPADWIQETVAMRRRTETRSRVRLGEFIDFKLGAGGMGDVEFLVQIIQLYTRRADLRGRRVAEVLAADDLPSLGGNEVSALVTAYRSFRRLETMFRIMLDERGSVLPVGENLERLAQVLDVASGDELIRQVRGTMQGVRSLFLQICNALSRR